MTTNTKTNANTSDTSTLMEKVDAILAEIEALPADARAFITKADAWESAHVAAAMLGAGLAGYLLHMILRFPF